jgi:hypothetical protein
VECQNCQQLTAVIEELSDLLAKAQQSRRRAFRDAIAYRRLLVMDMEENHASQSGFVE